VSLLRLEGINTYYGQIHILQDLSLEVNAGELVCLLGGNASGKSTTLKTILGLLPARAGQVRFAGQPWANGDPVENVRRGMALVPQGRGVFPDLTVIENLMLGAYTRRDAAGNAARLREVIELFPMLEERRAQRAGTLSGGQQQMLAIGRALMARPKLLLLDEPSMGLAPLLVDEIFRAIVALKREGATIFLVEQNAYAALAIADRGYVLETGRIVLQDSGKALLANERVKQAYLGI
jgi:branched-chain amino acid transport system ATP-binding protein